MNFQAVFAYLKRGHRAALPEWGGYWTWCDECSTIVMHARDGGVIDIRDSEDWDYTQSFMFRDDWELLDPEEETEHDVAWAEAEEELEVTEEEEAAFAFLEALLDELAQDDEEEDEFDLGLCDCEDCCEANEALYADEEEEPVEIRIYLI